MMQGLFMGIWVRDLPFPLSVNHIRMPRVVGKRIMPIKTKEYRQYEADMKAAILSTRLSLRSEPWAFYAFLYAPREHWFTIKNKAQPRDLDNFLKALVDCTMRNLGVDDKWIFELHAYKCIGRQRVDVMLTHDLSEEPKEKGPVHG